MFNNADRSTLKTTFIDGQKEKINKKEKVEK